MEEKEQKAYHRYIRGIILIGLAMLLFKLLVTGILDKTTYKRTLFPLVKISKVEKINKPTDPYVYDALPQ